MKDNPVQPWEHLWDSIAVNLQTNRVRVLKSGARKQNAEACSKMAICKRGVEEEMFVESEHDRYKDGDIYEGQ